MIAQLIASAYDPNSPAYRAGQGSAGRAATSYFPPDYEPYTPSLDTQINKWLSNHSELALALAFVAVLMVIVWAVGQRKEAP